MAHLRVRAQQRLQDAVQLHRGVAEAVARAGSAVLGEPNAQRLVDEEQVPLLVPMHEAWLQLVLAIELERPELVEEAEHGAEAWTAVHPHDHRRVGLAVLRQEEPVKELCGITVAHRQQPCVGWCRQEVLEAGDEVVLVPRMGSSGEREQQPGSGAPHETEPPASCTSPTLFSRRLRCAARLRPISVLETRESTSRFRVE